MTESAADKAEKQETIWTLTRQCLAVIRPKDDEDMIREVANAMLKSIGSEKPPGPTYREPLYEEPPRGG